MSKRQTHHNAQFGINQPKIKHTAPHMKRPNPFLYEHDSNERRSCWERLLPSDIVVTLIYLSAILIGLMWAADLTLDVLIKINETRW